MVSRPVSTALLLFALATGPACGVGVDLASALEVTDVFTGWQDNGVRGGQNHLVPSVSFRLKNVATRPVSGVRLMVSFWAEGDDGERDSSEVRGIGADGLEPNAETDTIRVVSEVGFTLSGPKDTFFQHTLYRPFTAKVFARHAGRIVPLGEFVLDERIIPRASSGAQ